MIKPFIKRVSYREFNKYARLQSLTFECKKDQLKAELKDRYCKEDPKISDIIVYTHPLERMYSWSPGRISAAVTTPWTRLDKHAFVVFKTEDGRWWSLDKNMEGIFIQRGQTRETVVNSFQYHTRKPIVELDVEDEAKGTLCDLFSFLFVENDTTDGYNAVYRNCQHFSQKVFDKYEFISPRGFLSAVTLVEFLLSQTGVVFIVLMAMLVFSIKLIFSWN